MALYLLICIITWANAIHEKWMGRCPITRVSVIAESVQWNSSTLNTSGIWKVHIHSGALVASLCFDDLFHSELIIEFMLKNSLLICCYWKSGGGWVSTIQPLWGVIMKWRWFSYLLAPSWKVLLILQPGALQGTASKRWWVLQGGKWWMEDMVITT